MTKVTDGLTLETRFPDDDVEDPDTSESYPNDDDNGDLYDGDADPLSNPDVIAQLRAAGFNVKRLRQAWGDGSKLQ